MKNNPILKLFHTPGLIYDNIFKEKKCYAKNELILGSSSDRDELGIMLEGTAYLQSVEDNGDSSLIEFFAPGDIVSNLLPRNSNVSLYFVTAKSKASILFFSRSRILDYPVCNDRLIISAAEYLMTEPLDRARFHTDILLQRSIRGKLMALFRHYSFKTGQKEFTLPIPLSDVADYIAADRSAMMREIRKMNNEHIISSQRQTIILLE